MPQAQLEKIKLPPLPPIDRHPSATQLNQARDKVIKDCANWRSAVRFNRMFPNIAPGKTKRLERLDERRVQLLVNADWCATRILAKIPNGFRHATNMIIQVRQYLAKAPEEEDMFLTTWQEPER
jgi:hypothetical protein